MCSHRELYHLVLTVCYVKVTRPPTVHEYKRYLWPPTRYLTPTRPIRFRRKAPAPLLRVFTMLSLRRNGFRPSVRRMVCGNHRGFAHLWNAIALQTSYRSCRSPNHCSNRYQRLCRWRFNRRRACRFWDVRHSNVELRCIRDRPIPRPRTRPRHLNRRSFISSRYLYPLNNNPSSRISQLCAALTFK